MNRFTILDLFQYRHNKLKRVYKINSKIYIASKKLNMVIENIIIILIIGASYLPNFDLKDFDAKMYNIY